MTPKHVSDFTLNSSSDISVVPIGLAFLSQESPIYERLPWAYTWIQAQIRPYSAQPQRRCSHSRARLGGKRYFKVAKKSVCLHRNKPASPKDQLSVLIKERVWRTRDIRRVVLGEMGRNPNTPARAHGRRWRWPWATQDLPAPFGVPAGQRAKLSRLQNDRQK